jgi:hypothetical protein
MDGYVDYPGVAFHEAAEDAGDRSRHHFRHPSAATMSDHSKTAYYGAGGQQPIVCDIKPRLTKSQHEMLETEYTKQSKPTTSTKKGFAEALGVSLDKVNVSITDTADNDVEAETLQ